MKTCDGVTVKHRTPEHERISYECDDCPLCAALSTVDEAENIVEQLVSEIDGKLEQARRRQRRWRVAHRGKAGEQNQ